VSARHRVQDGVQARGVQSASVRVAPEVGSLPVQHTDGTDTFLGSGLWDERGKMGQPPCSAKNINSFISSPNGYSRT
jgi:hypothetical protein